MRLFEILTEDARQVWTITFKDQWTDEAGPDDGEFPDIERWEFDVRYNGKVVGSIEYDNYFNHIQADFGARTVELSKYVSQYVDDPEQVILQAVGNYFNSPKGKNHFEIMARQKGLQPQSIELEEEEQEVCPACKGDGTVVVGDSQLVFDCSDCKGRGYFGPEHGMRDDLEEEELEEIKVTKTVAGSKQPPSRKLAMKNKKESPNQGKQAVEIDKMPDAKDLATITLKGEYNQRTK